MSRALRLLLLATSCAAACTSRTASEDTTAFWPDAFIDLAPSADTRGPDRALVDTGPDGPVQPWRVLTVTTEDLHAAACVNGRVYVAGNKGTMLYRYAGTGFAKQSVPTTVDLYAVAFFDTSYGATAGKDYAIWETKSRGSQWGLAGQCGTYIFDAFYALHLDSATTGFAAGLASSSAGAGYKYYNGVGWYCAGTPYANEIFYDVYRVGQGGWIVGKTGGKIYRTEDGGTNWTAVSTSTTETLRGVTFAGATLGLAVGDKGTILRSTDGKGWTAVTSGVTADLYDVYLFSAQVGWAVGAGGTLLQTQDGGQTWTARASTTTKRLEAVCFTSSLDGWAVGEAGTIVYTTTGGM